MLFVNEESHMLGIRFEVNEKCKWDTRVRVNFGSAVLTHGITGNHLIMTTFRQTEET